ncbi:TPA: hypothetical protein ACH3X3_012571 [Trebouxia sp. C0006]
MLHKCYKTLLERFHPLQLCKARNFTWKGSSAPSSAAWPSNLFKAGMPPCPKAALAHLMFLRWLAALEPQNLFKATSGLLG